ncbi:uncharacterized protein LOC110858996 [Folsomia candida]|uniref:F-box domain-containing protein n=1 Tax=Folsomia candida TaxID=158441 RepID=A0A226DDK8_FOLCA|nr:uncharacterized protein LOC110858996 [Folsomia candida]XP_035715058.1 uncharacterized protein LOC110858996 [Folsomia candida]XP_035715059.1 uncharacterized protein LOC110858996 [Folsomia candida]OXA43048.1 hypothetical protein Fcan01_21945 [Folsomia candida]
MTELTPQLNGNVIHRISTFLPVPDLLSCRLVDTLWNSGVLPEFRKRTTLHLTCPPPPEEFSRHQNFTETMPFYPLHNVAIKFGSDSENKNPPQNINYSVFTKTLQFRRLTLNPIRIGRQAELDVLLGILSSSIDILEELSLDFDTVKVSMETSSWNYWSHKFPKVTRLTLSRRNRAECEHKTVIFGRAPIYCKFSELFI